MDMAEALQAANELDAQHEAAGFDQAALDDAARRGFGNDAFETAGTYLIESPVTEADILLMAKQLASRRLHCGRQLTAPRDVFSRLQTLLEAYEHDIFAGQQAPGDRLS